MINLNKLEGAMRAAGYKTREQGAKSIGMQYSTFCRKMNDGSFDCDEAYDIIKKWNIERPEEIFFVSKVARGAI